MGCAVYYKQVETSFLYFCSNVDAPSEPSILRC